MTWNNITEELHSEFAKLSDKLEENIKPIMREIEKALEETLDITLEPSELNITKPSYTSFYGNIDTILNSLVDKTGYGGLLGILFDVFAFFYNKIGKSKIFSSFDSGTYQISSLQYFKQINNYVTKPAIIELRSLIDEIIRQKYIKSVKDMEYALSEYVDRYTSILLSELEAKEGENINIEDRIEQIKKDISNITDFVDDINVTKKMVLVPI